MAKYDFTKDLTKEVVIEFHGVREKCSEGYKFKCPDCGTTDSVAVWLEHSNACHVCGNNAPVRICSRCEDSITLTEGSSDHPCNSTQIYETSARIIFFDEMIAEYSKKNPPKKKDKVDDKPPIIDIDTKLPKPEVPPESDKMDILDFKIEEEAPLPDDGKIESITQQIYNLGKIPRCIIKAIRRLIIIFSFSTKK